MGNVIELPPRKPKRRGGVLYDFTWIRQNISILEVARQLGMYIPPPGQRWTMVQCFRPQNHKADDRSPSLGLSMRLNRFMCFNCDEKTRSNLDLVSEFHDIDLRQAAEWIAARFPGVPTISTEARKPEMRDLPDFRAGVSEPLRTLEDHIRAGLLAQLDNSELRVLMALWAYRDAGDVAEVSYQQIMQCAGLGGRATVAAALQLFESMELVRVIRSWQLGTGRRAPNRVLLTLDSEDGET
jgi:hypothetical protein